MHHIIPIPSRNMILSKSDRHEIYDPKLMCQMIISEYGNMVSLFYFYHKELQI